MYNTIELRNQHNVKSNVNQTHVADDKIFTQNNITLKTAQNHHETLYRT